MTSSTLIRARWIVTGAGRDDPLLGDSALLTRGAEIIESGPWAKMREAHADAEVVGGPGMAVIPGLVNAHHHSSGITQQQQALADDFLEPWILDHAGLRASDVALNTLMSAARLLRSGVTSVVDVHPGGGSAEAYSKRVEQGLSAYRRSGMRVAFTVGSTTRSHLVHGHFGDDEDFLARLPGPLADAVRCNLMPSGEQMDEDDYFAIVEEALARHADNPLVNVWFGPPGPQWVGDDCLLRIAERAAAFDTGIQTHLCESYYEKLMGPRLYGKTPLRHLYDLGILGPRFSIAHGVWLNDADIELMAETGTGVSHNPSSNLRLRAGIAPLAAYLAAGATTALGMDGTSINDDEDMFAEMRLALRLARGPILGTPAPSPRDILATATLGGAKLMGLEGKIGRLTPGNQADLVILDLERIVSPWIAPECDPLELIVLRAKTEDVRSVMVSGRLVYHEGKVLGFDAESVGQELADKLKGQYFRAEAAETATKIRPYLEAYYRTWETGEPQPYTYYNSRT